MVFAVVFPAILASTNMPDASGVPLSAPLPLGLSVPRSHIMYEFGYHNLNRCGLGVRAMYGVCLIRWP